MWERKTLLIPKQSNLILCSYVNTTRLIQVVRSANVTNWYLERVVFPAQRFWFEAPPEACIEVHTGTTICAILSDKIPCDRLHIKDKLLSQNYL
jgi:hypothetical protein